MGKGGMGVEMRNDSLLNYFENSIDMSLLHPPVNSLESLIMRQGMRME